MTKVKIMLHSGISREYRKKYQVPYKEFWQSTKTLYIKDEESSWRITGYIAGNLLKHREVSTFVELESNPFSSYKYIAEKLSGPIAQELVRSVINVDESIEGEVDIGELNKVRLPRGDTPLPWAG